MYSEIISQTYVVHISCNSSLNKERREWKFFGSICLWNKVLQSLLKRRIYFTLAFQRVRLNLSIRLIENSCRISDLGNSHLIIFFSSTNSKFSFKEFSEWSKANTLSDIPIKRPSQKHIIQMNLQKKSLLIFIYRKLNSKGDVLYI